MFIPSQDVLPHSESVTQQMGKSTYHSEELLRSLRDAPDIPAPREHRAWRRAFNDTKKFFFLIDFYMTACL